MGSGIHALVGCCHGAQDYPKTMGAFELLQSTPIIAVYGDNKALVAQSDTPVAAGDEAVCITGEDQLEALRQRCGKA